MIYKSISALILSYTFLALVSCGARQRAADPDADPLSTPYRNPIIYADVPDMSLCRVGEDYYMVSTTMHLMPGAPIMHSRDLRHWETISYIFDTIDDGPRYHLRGDSTAYGQGQWASSLRYHDGRFYVWFTANGAPHRGFIYSATDPRGPWTLVARPPHYHDASLLFDDDGRVYLFHSTGQLTELRPDLTDRLEGGINQSLSLAINQPGSLAGSNHPATNTDESEEPNPTGLKPAELKLVDLKQDPDEGGLLEGSAAFKHNGFYYLMMISWNYNSGGLRREVCYRSNSITGPYEKRVILETAFDGYGGVGQGCIVDSPSGDWYALIFQDREGVGRVPCLMPCTWTEDGWPMLGKFADNEPGAAAGSVSDAAISGVSDAATDGVPSAATGQLSNTATGHGSNVATGRIPNDTTLPYTSTAGICGSDDFSSPTLSLFWQWNHHPISEAWSLTDRPGYLRLTTARLVPNLYLAPNTLTQRMPGPRCQGTTCLHLSGLRPGDVAGLAALNGDSGVLAIEQQADGSRRLVFSEQRSIFSEPQHGIAQVDVEELWSAPLTADSIYLRIDAAFGPITPHATSSATDSPPTGPVPAIGTASVADTSLQSIPASDLATFSYSLDGRTWATVGRPIHMTYDYRRLFMGTRFALFCYATQTLGGYVDIDNFALQTFGQEGDPQ